MKTKILVLSVFLVTILMLKSEIKVASVLGDNMVLQRNTEVKIWGTTTPLEKISVKTDWGKSTSMTTADNSGHWMVKIKTTEAGGPFNIKIAAAKESITLKNILLGEVWLCSGQSNMEMPVNGYTDQPIAGMNDALYDSENDNIRLFTVKKNATTTVLENCDGNWNLANAETVGKFSAVGYFYAKLLQKRLKVPVGIICSSWGGTPIEAWMSEETIKKFPVPYEESTKSDVKPQNKAAQLYNGMIAPLINYTIKGAIWYQGEANVRNYNYYADLMSAMIQNWRTDFGVGQFPFYFVQIAPYRYKGSKDLPSALLRDEQLKANLAIPNTGMACTFDIGDEYCIHPDNKLTVSKRLAYWALSETYGVKGISYKSPIFKSMTVKDSVATITFDNVANGLNSFGKQVECFEVSGQDSIFYPAKVTVSQRTALVKSELVKVPVAVRYGYCNFPKTKGYLYNTAGLPVPSFRTDNWRK
jgi:sialate O-acetylesterase